MFRYPGVKRDRKEVKEGRGKKGAKGERIRGSNSEMCPEWVRY